jgi:hypothetical protein
MAQPSKKAVFISKRMLFEQKHDMVMGHMAMDIEVMIKTGGQTPVDTGTMKSQTRHFRSPKGGFRVESDVEYAAVQEAGERNGIKFRNYTTAGTGPHWFKGAIAKVWENRENYLEVARKAVGL